MHECSPIFFIDDSRPVSDLTRNAPRDCGLARIPHLATNGKAPLDDLLIHARPTERAMTLDRGATHCRANYWADYREKYRANFGVKPLSFAGLIGNVSRIRSDWLTIPVLPPMTDA